MNVDMDILGASMAPSCPPPPHGAFAESEAANL